MSANNGRGSHQLLGATFGGFGHLPAERTLRRPSGSCRHVGARRHQEPKEQRRPNRGISFAHPESPANDPKRPLALSLLLPRADIADHLGTSIETVCRTLAEFKMKGLIDLPNRKTIRYLNLQGLLQIAGD